MSYDLLAEKLDILIKLTAANVIKEDKSQTDSILKLRAMGIGNQDISKILRTSINYVAMIISKNKNKDKKKLDDNISLGGEQNANE